MEFPINLAAEVEHNVLAALAEDIGSGDLTALLTPANKPARATVIAREEGILCGTAWFDACFRRLDPSSRIRWNTTDSQRFQANQVLCEIESDSRAMLTAERSALNFLQLLSSTASATRRYVDAVAGTRAQIVDTRKTLPSLRLAQKYAVRCGGGGNHRIGLYDGILIKENHILAAGSIAAAMERARAIAREDVFIQLEVENLDELQQGLDAGATMILLDNMTLDQMRDAVRLTNGRAKLEASGGVRLDTVRGIAETGVDRISVGSLTKDTRAIDLSMRHTG
ncbi:nicotinate-nucleotide pyrophosphorylase [carboxylating] [Noviherbaspirillum humi]|uniref:Probable nicotinate-nucleotide pyrophosphorylase [carboxylating] n=1 Tax=Noviherbaspirillum humi TaxID=1688639 RepID=A0A239FSQ3_9BURK|nr:carboxylating nicotinate-nucleotide diphosphorylase [Noviherbaspirillum humi]SNS60096.1 nicotinate-nucleotide pyrophosphorylase [carboxylating] [Noviherbaspirillum humi]